MKSQTQRSGMLGTLAVILFLGCQEEPTAPVGDTYVVDMTHFEEFELTYMPHIFCLTEGMLRSMRIVRSDFDTTFTVNFKIVLEEYCSADDTLSVEEVPARPLSGHEVNLLLKTFSRVEIRRSNPTCEGEWGSFIRTLARWDSRWWTEDCDYDHLSDTTSSQLYVLADSLRKGAGGTPHNRALHAPGACSRQR